MGDTMSCHNQISQQLSPETADNHEKNEKNIYVYNLNKQPTKSSNSPYKCKRDI